jgi:hypothetical protein
MITTVIAKIAGATPAESFTGRDGQTVTKCTIIVKTIEAYPQTLALTAFGELTPWAMQTGKTVEIGVGMSSREHEGRWYSELRAVSIKYAQMPAGETER